MKISKKEKTLLGVDTVRIALTDSNFRVLDLSRFKRTANALVCSPSAIDKALGSYIPHLYYTTRTNFGNTPRLFIEFSLPKIAFGNNLQELTVADKELVLQKLHSSLRSVGVQTDIENLLRANISRLDVGKNVIVPNTTIALKEINGMLPRDRKFLDNVKYENGGRGAYIRNSNFTLAIYDKLSDPLLPKKYRFDEDVYTQTELLKLCTERNIQVLRLEGRFMKREDVKRLYKLYGIQNPVFEDVFHPEIAYEIITKEWKKLTSCYVPTQNPQKTLLEQAIDVLHDNRDVLLHNILAGLCIQQLLKCIPLGELRKVFRRHSSGETVRNTLAKAHKIKYGYPESQDVVDSISKQLLEWQPLKLSFETLYDKKSKDYNINIDEESDEK